MFIHQHAAEIKCLLTCFKPSSWLWRASKRNEIYKVTMTPKGKVIKTIIGLNSFVRLPVCVSHVVNPHVFIHLHHQLIRESWMCHVTTFLPGLPGTSPSRLTYRFERTPSLSQRSSRSYIYERLLHRGSENNVMYVSSQSPHKHMTWNTQITAAIVYINLLHEH